MLLTLQEAPWPESDVILSVRFGKIQALGKGGLQSAIHKQPSEDYVEVSQDGIAGDEREYIWHQNPDNAIHQYCADHYPTWQRDKPEKKHMFEIGAFGENISLQSFNEDNVCVGDIFEIGDGILAQVSGPRTPCFKLNARFEWPQAAKRVQKSNRYGWYLRVLHNGRMKVGDRMTLVKRLNARWTVRNTMNVLFDREVSDELKAEVRSIEGLAKELQNIAERRFKGEENNDLARTKGSGFDYNPYEIEDAQMITPRIRQLTLSYRGPETRAITETYFTAHQYVNLRFGAGDNSFERSYSVVSGDLNHFILGISLDDNSRGGSKFLHEVMVGARIDVSRGESGESAHAPEGFEREKIPRHIFLIGGIGVTAFLRSIKELLEKKVPVEVHYACRSREDAAYKDQLPENSTTYYAKDEKKRLGINKIIPSADKDGNFDAFIYACGPNSLMNAIEERCEKLGYPPYHMHMESFGAPTCGPLGEAFEAEVYDLDTEKQATVKVSEEKTLLDALEDAGFDVAYSCRAGKCGICVVNVKCSGEIKHKGTGLMEEAKDNSMLSCVSRAKGKIQIEIE